MPNEETTVEVVVENPSNPPQEEHSQSLEVLVGELKAKVSQLEQTVTTLTEKDQQIENLVEEVGQIQRWTTDDLNQMMRSLWEEMSQMRSDVEELNENETELIEQENELSNLEEIPLIPEQVPQEEPEEVVEVKTRRPWFL